MLIPQVWEDDAGFFVAYTRDPVLLHARWKRVKLIALGARRGGPMVDVAETILRRFLRKRPPRIIRQAFRFEVLAGQPTVIQKVALARWVLVSQQRFGLKLLNRTLEHALNAHPACNCRECVERRGGRA